MLYSLSAYSENLNNNIGRIPHIPTDTTVIPQILSLPLTSFIGKPVDSLLSVLPPGYSTRDFMPVGIGYTRGICQSYFSGEFNNCFIEIYIDVFNHLPIPNRTKTTTWNMNLAKQEKIAFIKVVKNNNICLYGCNNPNYSYP
jgi:hypothetical protein